MGTLSPSPERPLAGVRAVSLRIDGMTCAACADRVERRLNRVPGVLATVNFATQTAQVQHPSAVTVDDHGHHAGHHGASRPGSVAP